MSGLCICITKIVIVFLKIKQLLFKKQTLCKYFVLYIEQYYVKIYRVRMPLHTVNNVIMCEVK